MNRPTGTTRSGQSSANTKMASKTQQLSDYRRRLKDAMRSCNENIVNLMTAVKIPTNDDKYTAGQKAAHYSTVRYEVITRTTLIIKALEELLTLNNDVKSYMILRDFKSINEAVVQNDFFFKTQVHRGAENYDTLRTTCAGISESIDKEIQEQFYRLN